MMKISSKADAQIYAQEAAQVLEEHLRLKSSMPSNVSFQSKDLPQEGLVLLDPAFDFPQFYLPKVEDFPLGIIFRRFVCTRNGGREDGCVEGQL